MNLQTFFTLYAISVPIFLVIDLLWLGVIASDFYQKRMGDLLTINWTASIIFYFVFLLGLTIFVMYPQVDSNWKSVLMWGALFGFFTYATYDLTNLATLKDWPLDLVLVDMAWGTVLGGSVAVITHYLYNLL